MRNTCSLAPREALSLLCAAMKGLRMENRKYLRQGQMLTATVL